MTLAPERRIDEVLLVKQFLAPLGELRPCSLVQVGANDGKFEYAKPDGRDFVFEFLRENRKWKALLIEPIPDTFDILVDNYRDHENELHFLNCAITDNFEIRVLHKSGPEGKRSTLCPETQKGLGADIEEIEVNCLPFYTACELVNIHLPEFVKIDAEGFDERIVHQSVDRRSLDALPSVIMWEQIGPEAIDTSLMLCELGYHVFRAGRTRHGAYVDKVALNPLKSPPDFRIESILEG